MIPHTPSAILTEILPSIQFRTLSSFLLLLLSMKTHCHVIFGRWIFFFWFFSLLHLQGTLKPIQLSVRNSRILLLTLWPPTVPSQIPCLLSLAKEDSTLRRDKIKSGIKPYSISPHHNPWTGETGAQGRWITCTSILKMLRDGDIYQE